MAYEDKLIEHLSSEIGAYSAYLSTFRSRIAFSVLVGPFVVLGSFLIATKGTVSAKPMDAGTIVSLVVASASYLALGAYGALLDGQVTQQCDKWRRQMDRISQGMPLEITEFVFPHRNQIAYLMGVILVLFAFLSVAYFLKFLVISGAG